VADMIAVNLDVTIADCWIGPCYYCKIWGGLSKIMKFNLIF